MTARALNAFLLAGTLFSATALAARAEPAPATPAPAPATAPASEPANPMGGPNVKPADAIATKPTLVKRDFAGKLQPLDTRPEYAALDLLKLSPTEKSAIETFRTQRATRVGQVLQKHYTLFLDIQGSNQSGERAKAMTKIRELRAAEPDLFDPPLAEQLSGPLSAENKAIFSSLVDEYLKAEAEDRTPSKAPSAGEGEDSMREKEPATPTPTSDARPRRRPGAAGSTPPAYDAQRRETMRTIREIGGTLKATVQDRSARSDAVIKAIGATPELEEQIRQILRSSLGGNVVADPTPEARIEATRKIFALLTPEQRKQWIAATKER